MASHASSTHRDATPGLDEARGLPRLDRLAAAVLLLAVALAAAATFVVAVGWVQPAELVGGLPAVLALLSQAQAESTLLRGAIAAGAALIGLGALSLLVRRGAGRRGAPANVHVLDADAQGMIVVDSRSIAAVAEGTALCVPGVLECAAEVRGSGQRPVRVLADVTIRPGAEVRAVAQQVRQRIQSGLDEMVGVPVREVVVRVHVLEPPELGRVLS